MIRCLTPAADKAVRKSLKSSSGIIGREERVGEPAEVDQCRDALAGGHVLVVGAGLREFAGAVDSAAALASSPGLLVEGHAATVLRPSGRGKLAGAGQVDRWARRLVA